MTIFNKIFTFIILLPIVLSAHLPKEIKPDQCLTKTIYLNGEFVKVSDILKNNLVVDSQTPLTNSRTNNRGKRQWYVEQTDKGPVKWFVKSDNPDYPELQTSIEPIVSQIYRFFGYITPITVKFKVGNDFFAASRDVFTSKNEMEKKFTDLSDINLPEVRQISLVTMFVNNWAMLGDANNIVCHDGSLVFLDFGGSLGSRDSGLPKYENQWNGILVNNRVGVFRATDDLNVICKKTFVIEAEQTHPWRHLTEDDVRVIHSKFSQLDDATLEKMVAGGAYTHQEDADYILKALKKRRDGFIHGLFSAYDSGLFQQKLIPWPKEYSTKDQILAFKNSTGKKVVTVFGYASASYEKINAAMNAIWTVLHEHFPPNEWIVNLPGTAWGVGNFYAMAQAKGYETMGIISTHVLEVTNPDNAFQLKYPGFPSECEHLFLIDDAIWGGFKDPDDMQLSPTTQNMVAISDAVIQVGGNEVGADELIAALNAKSVKKIIFIPAKMHPSHDDTDTSGFGFASTRINKVKINLDFAERLGSLPKN